MSGKLMSYVLETIISEETAKASVESDKCMERPRKQKKRSHFFLLNAELANETESTSDEDMIIKDLTKYILEQVNIMKHLLPGRSVIDILNRIKQMEIARDINESPISSASDINSAFVLEEEF